MGAREGCRLLDEGLRGGGYIAVYTSSVGLFTLKNTSRNYSEKMRAVGGPDLANYHRLHTHCTDIFAKMSDGPNGESLTYHELCNDGVLWERL